MPLPRGALISSPEWKTLLRPKGLRRHPNTLDILPMTGHLKCLDDVVTLVFGALALVLPADAATAATLAPGRNISLPILSCVSSSIMFAA
ncbi:hypothetical protein SDC9_148900 [bioreactor metagenome]|uniref:Uncharacterized protein n=1 Tax=bioreactor metagenome TaxID=1076179 RepID=A0A645EKP4_9ZZZZ